MSEDRKEIIEINLVSEEEMYKRNKYLKVGLICNPFYLQGYPSNNEPRTERIKMLKRGVTKNMAKSILNYLYTKEATNKILELLDEGITRFKIGFENGEGYLRWDKLKKELKKE